MASEEMGEGVVAVQLRHACKHYGRGRSKAKILDGLDMTVTKGTIYVLLGASGCGKTTLLNCIIGLRKLDAGGITVLGGIPGDERAGVPGHRIGYMPQELSLLQDFTIEDALTYFGWIFGITGKELKARTEFLVTLLQLTSKRKEQIKCLSGGQQRRVSFAAALLHDAELLILDEPTVGLDPELRQSIWDYLKEITESGSKTAIITTHYIEEAKQANTIGIMRKGRLLAQDTPGNLLMSHGTDSLEDVFLDLSKLQEKTAAYSDLRYPQGKVGGYFYAAIGEATEKSIVNDRGKHKSHLKKYYESKMESGLQSVSTQEMSMDYSDSKERRNARAIGRWKALLLKNYIQFSRNLGSLFFIFGFPLTTFVLFFLAIGRDPEGLHLAIVNQEVGFFNVSSHGCLGYQSGGCNDTALSCRYMQSLGNGDILKEEYYEDEWNAMEAVRQGKAWGAVIIPENFTSALEQRRDDGKDADGDVLAAGEISVYLDMSNNIIGTLLKRKLQSEFQNFLRDVLKDCEYNSKFGESPVKFNDPVFGKKSPSFRSFIAPGLLNSTIYFVVVGMTAITMVKEKEEGLWDRMMAAGITPWQILVSHTLTTTVLVAMQTALILVVSLFILGIECRGSVVLLAAHIFTNGIIGMAFGLLISLVCRNVGEANYLSTGSFYPYILLCGILWPIEGLPWYIYHLSRFLPLTLSTVSLRDIMVKGWGLSWPSVYAGYLATITWTIFYLACSYALLRFKKS